MSSKFISAEPVSFDGMTSGQTSLSNSPYVNDSTLPLKGSNENSQMIPQTSSQMIPQMSPQTSSQADSKTSSQTDAQTSPQTSPHTSLQPPSVLLPVLEKYRQVVESPEDLDVMWDFVQFYLTFLESRTNMIIPLIQENSPQLSGVQLSGKSLMMVLKDASIKDIPWSIYNIFLTISNIGALIAQKEPKDDRDKFYILYVMLSIDSNDSPTYSFTELLQNLQNSQEGSELYSKLDARFLKEFAKYENTSLVSKCSNYIRGNPWIWALIAFLIILLIGLSVASFYSTSVNDTSTSRKSTFGIISGFGTDD